MRNFTLAIVAGFLALTTAAQAQTYGDKLYEEGALTLSNMETHIRDILVDAGVPEDCLLKLSLSDAAEFNRIINSDANIDGKRRQAKIILDRAC